MNLQVHPELTGVAAERLFELANKITRAQAENRATTLPKWADAEAEWARNNKALNGQAGRYEAAARLLIDLVMLKWKVRVDAGEIELQSPEADVFTSLTSTQIREIKSNVRRELEPVLREQFANPSVIRFITETESPPETSQRKSIKLLIADGSEVYERLAEAVEAHPKDRAKILQGKIKPYLQLVPDESEPTQRDTFTGIPLGDVWRYFRYTWSIPQTPIPGRQLLYLVRDAAHPCHAIMGIAALSNSPMQSGVRDGEIGWSTDAFRKRLTLAAQQEDRAELKHCREYLRRVINDALAEIEIKHLVTQREISKPTEETIERLRRRSLEFAERRNQALTEFEDVDSPPEFIQEAEPGPYVQPPVSRRMIELEGRPVLHSTQLKARQLLVAKKRAFELSVSVP